MGFLQDGDVKTLLNDPALMSDIAKAAIEDPDTVDSLASEIADKLSDELEDDPMLRKQIVDAAMNSQEFKNKIVRKLVDDLG